MDFLQTCLQVHLATDDAAASNAPHVVALLKTTNFDSTHAPKWTNRVNALFRARDPGARWAGLVLAHQTARLSRALLTSSAQVWIAAALPMLSRSEAVPVWKAAIKLLAYISLSTTSLPEFQRTIVHPNVPKLSSALVSLTEKSVEEDFSVLCLATLTELIRAFPSLHRSVTVPISSLCLRLLDGSSRRTPYSVVSAASKLYASLHVTGGKVGGSALWRKGVDETITYTRKSLNELRSTYVAEGLSSSISEPARSITLAIDRLCCGTELLCAFLTSEVSRPVILPVNAVISLCIDILRAEDNAQLRDDLDPTLRSAEAALVPAIHKEGCKLTAAVAECLQTKMSPYFNQILIVVAHHLERQTTLNQRLAFVRMISTLFTSCNPPSDPLLVGRLVKALLPSLTPLLSSDFAKNAPKAVEAVSAKKAGKQKAPGFDDDQVFKFSRDRLCESEDEGELVLAVLEALPILIRTPNVPAYLQSLTSRVYLSLLTLLPALPASTIAHDPMIKERILSRAREACVGFTSGSSTALCRSLPLVIDAVCSSDRRNCMTTRWKDVHDIDLMIHPRLPPLVRALPNLPSMSLLHDEEGKDERTTRETLGLRSGSNDAIAMDVDVPQAPLNSLFIDSPPVVQQAGTMVEVSVQPPVGDLASTTLSRSDNTVTIPPKLDGSALTAVKSPDMSTQAPANATTVSITQIAKDVIQVESIPSRDTETEVASVMVAVPPASDFGGIASPRPPLPTQPPAQGHDSFAMAVDSDEDDIEYPTLNTESDTDSDVEVDP